MIGYIPVDRSLELDPVRDAHILPTIFCCSGSQQVTAQRAWKVDDCFECWHEYTQSRCKDMRGVIVRSSLAIMGFTLCLLETLRNKLCVW